MDFVYIGVWMDDLVRIAGIGGWIWWSLCAYDFVIIPHESGLLGRFGLAWSLGSGGRWADGWMDGYA